MNLLDALRQYLGDASPGGALNPEMKAPMNAISGFQQSNRAKALELSKQLVGQKGYDWLVQQYGGQK